LNQSDTYLSNTKIRTTVTDSTLLEVLVEDEDVTAVVEADAGRESDATVEAGALEADTGLEVGAVLEADTGPEVGTVSEVLVIVPMLVTGVVSVVAVSEIAVVV
jgi:hypothetical protein